MGRVSSIRRGGIVLLVLLTPQFAWAWGARVHRLLVDLALEGLPADAPAWLREAPARERIDFMANQPDRWRGWNSVELKHVTDPDHYLDVENLDQFGLTVETIPHLRREYLRVLIIAKHVHPDNVEPYDAAKDPARTREWPGFVLHAVAEEYAKLQAAFNQARILEQVDDPARREQLAEAREVVIYHLGCLSHFAADIAQPLHTSRHYNGWLGENPEGYRWRERFHSYIDEGFADRHKLDAQALRSRIKTDRPLNAADPWDDVAAYLTRSHAQVVPLYTLERDGQLDGPEGVELISGQLADAAGMLTELIRAAYTSAAPTKKQVDSWLNYEGTEKAHGGPATQPASAPGQSPVSQPVSPAGGATSRSAREQTR